jgi:hypothetical protein
MDDDYVNTIISVLTEEQMKQILTAYITKRSSQVKISKKKLGSMRNIRATIYNKILSIIPEYTSEDISGEIDTIAYAIKHLVLYQEEFGNRRGLSREMIEGYAEIIARAIGDIINKTS